MLWWSVCYITQRRMPDGRAIKSVHTKLNTTGRRRRWRGTREVRCFSSREDVGENLRRCRVWDWTSSSRSLRWRARRPRRRWIPWYFAERDDKNQCQVNVQSWGFRDDLDRERQIRRTLQQPWANPWVPTSPTMTAVGQTPTIWRLTLGRGNEGGSKDGGSTRSSRETLVLPDAPDDVPVIATKADADELAELYAP